MSSKLEKELSSEFEYDSTKEYYYVSGDAQEIYFDGSKESVKLLKNLLNLRPNLKKQIFLKILPYWKYNPIKKTAKLPYDPNNNCPGNTILVSNRVVSFDFERKMVTIMNLSNPSKEKEFREVLLGLGLNVPEIVNIGNNYIQEELVNITRLGSLRRNQQVLEEIYEDLLNFYAFNGVNEENGVYKTLVHGDFHIGNLGMSQESIFIFVWENRGLRPIYYDLIKFLWVEYKHEKVFYKEVLEKLVLKTSRKLHMSENKLSRNVLYALDELMSDKDSKRADEFSCKVEKLYG